MNSKIYNGNVQPNPKEFKIWVDDEGTIRTWNGTEWIEATSGGGSGSGSCDDSMVYYDVRGNMDVLHGNYNILQYASMIFIKPYNTSDGIFEKVQPVGLVAYDYRFYGMNVNEYVLGVAIDKNVVTYYDGNYFDMVTDFESIVEDKSLIKHLTKEEFYNLEVGE